MRRRILGADGVAQGAARWPATPGGDYLRYRYAGFSDSRVRAPGTALDGLAPAQSPRHAASATAAWSPISGALVSLTVRYVGGQYEDDLQTDVLPAAAVVDAVARWPVVGRVKLIARAENLFDAAVVTRNQGGSMDLGAPRTLWIGLRIGE